MADRKNIHQTMLGVALVMARSRSVCPGGITGCVIATSDGRILAVGYNGPMHGADDDLKRCVRDDLDLHGGFGYEVCPCVHAEANAVAHAARHGVRLSGAVAYTTRIPCGTCARLLWQAGVEDFYALEKDGTTVVHGNTFQMAEQARKEAAEVAHQVYS